jgi:hypothetical protein
VLHDHVRHEVTSGKARLAGIMPADEQMSFSIVLPLRNESELDRMLGRLYDPSSPDYRQFVSVAEFTEKFGPSAEDYAAVLAFARASGLEPTASPTANRMVIPLKGTVRAVNKAFHVQMSLYEHPTEGRTFFSPNREPSLALGVPVAHLAGLNNYSLPTPMIRRPNGISAMDIIGSGPGGSYLASDMRTAYYGGTQLTGAGQAVGLVEFGGYYASDVYLTFSTAGQSFTVPINNVLLDGALAEPGENQEDAEQVLDIVQAIGMAPGLSQVRVYIGTGTDDANVLNSMASENIAKALSCSWGWLPEDPGTDDVFFKEFAAQGQSFFVASGDDGAFDAQIAPYFYPGEDDYVTAVGGTHLVTEAAGGPWSSEAAWNTPATPFGSGGGVSPDGIALPAWQSGVATAANGASTTLRNVPDVAMEGDFDNFNCDLGECGGGWAGTSFAAPRWAAFTALVNQQAVEAGTAPKGGIGFLNPSLYSLGAGSNSVHDFHDIVTGNNRTASQPIWYSAVTGYDLVTGWGSPTGPSLITDLAGKQAPGFWLSASSPAVEMNPGASGSTTVSVLDAGGFSGSVQLAVTSTLPSGVTAKWGTNPTSASSVLMITAAPTVANSTMQVTITGTSGSITETAQITLTVHAPSFSLSTNPGSVEVNPGHSVPATVMVTPLYGFTGSVKLAVTGLPTGVTATLGTNPTTGTSTLTLIASSTTATGDTTVTITGTSGAITAATTLVLSVRVPTFTLYGPTSMNMGAGTSAWNFIDVWGEYGFSGNVSFTIAGLPGGVTASFSPNPSSNYTNLTLTASSGTALGSSTVTVTGTSGSLKVTTTLQLNILAPTFTISANSSMAIGQGTTTTSQLMVEGEYGFFSGVNLAISGLPSGVTASLNPNPTTGIFSLTLTASSTAPLGTSKVTITGTSGTLKQSASFSLGVYVPTFSLTPTGPVSMGQGTSTSTNVVVGPEYGFVSSVNLAVSGLPAGVTASISPNPATGATQLTLTASNSAPVGNSTLTITGTSGTQTVKATLPLAVVAPTFTVSASGQVNLGIGSSAKTYVNVSPEYGYLGSVNLLVSGLPSGVTAFFSPNPTTGSSVLTLTANSTAVAGNCTITLTGTSGTATATTTFPLTLLAPGFALSTATEVDLGQGATSTASVSVVPANGFTGSVQLTVLGLPSGVTASFNPALITGSSVLTLTASSTVAVGTSTITITGNAGMQTVKTTVSLKVATPSFTIGPPSAVTMSQRQITTTYVNVNPTFGFTGSVTLSATGLPAGVTASFTPNPTNQGGALTLTANNTVAAGTTTVTVSGKWGSQTSTATLLLTIAAPSFSLGGPGQMQVALGSIAIGSVNVYASLEFTSGVTLAVSGLPSGVTAVFSPNPTNGSSTLTLAASNSATLGAATLTVTGTSGNLTATTTIQLQVHAAAFTLSSPTNLTIAPGGTVTGTVTVNPQFGFTGLVNLAVSGLPAGVTATWSSTPSSGYWTLTLTASNTAALAVTTVTITGTSGSLSASATFRLAVQTPSFTLNDSPVTLGLGTTTATAVFVSWQNAAGGNVNLAVSGLPSGITASFSPASANFQSTLTLTASNAASLGQYNAVITGTYGNVSSTALLNITVINPGFTLSNWGNLQVGQGNAVTSWINIQPQNGFSGTVRLSAVGLPNGVTALFSPNPSTQSSQLTITATSTAALGEYNASIVGTSGTQTVSIPLSVSVYVPTFTLGAYQSSFLTPGSSVQSFVNIQPLYGFMGSVSLSVSGLPTGVTGSFLPNPSTDQSTLTLSASNSATPGQYNLTVTGVSGKQTAATIMQLTISGNSFTLWSGGVSVGQGTSATTFVNANAQGTLSHPVQLTASGLPSGATASFSPNPTTSTSILTLTASSAASVGQYGVTLTGSSGGQQATTQIPVTVGAPTFTVWAPASVALGQGGTLSTWLYVNPQFGFAGAVTFSVTGLPSGVVAAFTPNPVTSSTSMTLTASASVIVGQYNVNLVGTSGTQSVSSPFILTIGAPSFSIWNEGNASVGQGTSATTYVSVNTNFGFSGSVSFSLSGLPSGVTASFSPNSSTGQSTLTLTATNTASPGLYLATISGSSGKMLATTPLYVSVVMTNFSLYCNGMVQLGQGASATGYVYLNSTSGFAGSVELTASGLPTGITASFSPNPTTQNSVMTLTASNSVAPGQYNFTLNGTAGSLTAYTEVQVIVYAPTFTMYVPNVSLGQGTSATSYINVYPQYGFTGSIQLAVTGLPTGVTASFTPNPATGSSKLTLSASSTASLGQYNLTITGTSGKQTASTTTSVAVYASAFTLTSPGKVILGQGTSTKANVGVNPLYGFTGNVQLAVSGLPSGVTASFSPNPATGSSSITLIASSAASLGEYTVVVTGTSGSQTATTTLTVAIYVPTFTISGGSSMIIGQGTSATSYVWVSPQYGFSGNVTFTVLGLPSGVTASFSPNPATNSSTLTLIASGTASLGQYTLTVTGTYGSQTASTSLAVGVYVPTFTIYSQSSVSIGQGTSVNSYVSVNTQYGFSGNVSLAVSGLPAGVTASFSPNPTTNSTTLTLTASGTTPLGQSTVTVTGTSGSQTSSTTFTLGVYVPTFTMYDYYVPALSAGGTAQSAVYIYEDYAFSGKVQLAVSGLPSGVTASFSPNPAMTSATMILTAGTAVSTGQYTLTITGTSGSQKAMSTVVLTVN